MSTSETDIIRDYFAPLSEGAKGAFGLSDDVCLVQENALVMTKDALVEGVHFRKKDSLDLVARKLLRVNLSDLAAKGAKPYGYLLACVWPKATSQKKIALFAAGLREEQERFKFTLLGGDTTAHKLVGQPLVLSATFLGLPSKKGLLRRSNAKVGDDIYVTGTIGDAGLGLQVLDGEGGFSKPAHDYLVTRYHVPEPRLTMGAALAGVATAAIDVSDGLIRDALHIADESDVQCILDANVIPLSDAAREWMTAQKSSAKALTKLATFGDDYEILFSAPQSMRRSVEMAAQASRTAVTRIGAIKRGNGVELRDGSGDKMVIPRTGYDHFNG